jgi:hypothetical protein
MAAKLASYSYYVPGLSEANLACYECGPTADAPPRLWWGGFSGPCCIAKTPAPPAPPQPSPPLPPPPAAPKGCNGWDIHNASGCTAAGNYSWRQVENATACCDACVDESQCMAWSFHEGSSVCNLGRQPKLAKNAGTAGTTCGCRHKGCPPGSPPPPVPCKPVYRPPPAKKVSLPPGLKTPPHFVTVLVDDLGFDDAEIRGSPRLDAVGASPHIAALRQEGILLDRHHAYLWCSPSRRAFL